MNRYMIFSGTNKDSSGGIRNFDCDLSDKESAVALAEKLKNIEDQHHGQTGWAQVYDTEDRIIILEI